LLYKKAQMRISMCVPHLKARANDACARAKWKTVKTNRIVTRHKYTSLFILQG